MGQNWFTDREKLWNSKLKAKNLQIFWDHWTIFSNINSKRSKQFLVTEFTFKKIIIHIEKNYCDSKICRKSWKNTNFKLKTYFLELRSKGLRRMHRASRLLLSWDFLKKSTVQQWQMYYNAKLHQPIVHPAQNLSKKVLRWGLLTTGFWGKGAWHPTTKWNTRFFFAFGYLRFEGNDE